MNSPLPVGLFAGALCCLSPAQGAPEPTASSSLARWVPEQAVLCVEILHSPGVVEPLISPAAVERFAALPVIAQGRQSEGYQGFMGLVRYVELTAQTNWQGVVRALTRDGLALAVGEGNRHLMVMDGGDATMLEELHGVAQQMAAGEAQKKGHPEWVDSRQVGEVTGWTFNGKEAHAVVGDRLFAASDPEVLEAALNLRGGAGRSLAARVDYQEARSAVGEDALAMVFLDLERLRESPQFSGALDQQRKNPLAALAFPTMPEVLRVAPWLVAGVYRERDSLHLRFFAGGEQGKADRVPFSIGDAERVGLGPSPQISRQIASLSLERDLAGFYGAKDDLFPQRSSGLIFFENMMGIFFSGRNLTDEVLAATRSDLRLVVARQEYDPAIGTPEPQLPGFALVIGLEDPEAFGEVLEEAWQKALGLVNFTRGQKALPGLILDRVIHRGVPITVAAYSAKEVPDREHLHQRYNFRPTLALAHGTAILSSTDQLARDLMDGLGQAQAGAGGESPGYHSVLQLAGAELQRILKANRAGMVRNNMIKEGKSEAEAEIGIDTLIEVVGWFAGAELRIGHGEHSELVDVRLDFEQH